MGKVRTVDLYRAVEEAELSDLRITGLFRPSPNGTEYKGFFFVREDAERFGHQQTMMGGPETFIVQASAPAVIVERSPAHNAASEGSGVLIPGQELLWVKYHD